MVLNAPGEDTIKSLSGATLKRFDTFKYLGSHLPSSLQDSYIRKAMAWDACNKLGCICKSDLDRDLKIRFFRACIESVQLYGSETWTITAKMKQRIDGCYTRLLRRALNISWRSHTTNKDLYCNIPLLSSTIRQRRLRFVGHCCRAENQLANKPLFWSPSEGKRGIDGSFKTFHTMLQEHGCHGP